MFTQRVCDTLFVIAMFWSMFKSGYFFPKRDGKQILHSSALMMISNDLKYTENTSNSSKLSLNNVSKSHDSEIDDRCSYENLTFERGSHFSPNPCTSCYCPTEKHARVECSVQDCSHTPSCLKWETAGDECCGTCVLYGCIHSDGQVHTPGSIVLSTPCELCVCPEAGGRVLCDRPSCPPLNCVDAVKDSEGCCMICPHGPNCWLKEELISGGRTYYRRDSCQSCRCPTHYIYWKDHHQIQAVCSKSVC